MKCDLCKTAPVEFTVTAAYEADTAATHPTWATYPMPMYRVCGAHLVDAMKADATRSAATPGYLIRGMQ